MGEERRRHERNPSFEILKVVSRDPGGGETVVPIMLRDRSHLGLGGVYVGEAALDPANEYLLREAGRPERRMRLVWISKSADYVYILGFLIEEE